MLKEKHVDRPGQYKVGGPDMTHWALTLAHQSLVAYGKDQCQSFCFMHYNKLTIIIIGSHQPFFLLFDPAFYI